MRDKPLSHYIKRTWRAMSDYQRLKYPVCRMCSQRESNACHHIAHKSTAKALILDEVNLVACCGVCHSKLHSTTPKRHSFDFIEEHEIFDRLIGREGIEYLQQHRHDIANWTRDELNEIYEYCKNKIKELKHGLFS